MSRIGNSPVELPSGVELKLQDGTLEVKGPKGSLSQALPSAIGVEIADDKPKAVWDDALPYLRAATVMGLVMAED